MSALRKLVQPGALPIEDGVLLFVRLLVGLTLALAHGLGKVSDLGKFAAKVGELGFPLPGLLGPAAALSEFVGGLLVALGLFTRAGAAAICITLCVAAFGVHADDPFKRKELALVYVSVALLLVARGGGKYSLDARLFPSGAGVRSTVARP